MALPVTSLSTAAVTLGTAAEPLYITDSGSLYLTSGAAVTITASGTQIWNDGNIISTAGTAVQSTGTSASLTIANDGLISGYLAFSGGQVSLTNSANGVVQGNISVARLVLVNDGLVSGSVQASPFIAGPAGQGSVSNRGHIAGDVDLLTLNFAAVVRNDGLIDGSVLVDAGTIAGAVFNTGTIGGFVTTNGGFSNTGVVGKSVIGGIEAQSFSNAGRILGNVEMSLGSDLYDGRSGTLVGAVYGDNSIGIGTSTDGGADTLLGGGAAETLYGGFGEDELDGGGGDDVLVGGRGADLLIGGAGLDLASYRHAQQGVVVSLADTDVNTGDAAGDQYDGIEGLAGSEFGDTLTGDAAANVLRGADGDDLLVGGAGNDTMRGGLGNDVFIVDSAGDRVIEVSAQGQDTVRSSVSYVLQAGVAVEAMETSNAGGTTAINLAGNGFANVITGNAGANVLRGRGGDDTIAGLGGNDTIVGGAGADSIAGGAGNDVLRFLSAAEGGDLIAGYAVAGDTIEVSASGFGGGLGVGALTAARFVANATGEADAPDGTGQFIFSNAVGVLFWDADGVGLAATPVAIAAFTGLSGTMASTEIVVIA